MPTPALPKLSPPRLFEALPRFRLFERLDALRARHPVVWVAAPPGAGKTTLAASYLEHIGAPARWFQVDDGDADPATFFHYLAATVPARPGESALPWLAPELAGDVPRFARRFFRAYFARLAPDTLVVLDNLQEGGNGTLMQCLEIAFAEVPEGLTLLLLSREPPGERVARFEVDGRVGVLDAATLQLDEMESRALARIEARAPTPAWLALMDGWAAGVIMLREHMDTHDSLPDPATFAGRDTLFRYFAAEILGELPRASQRTLLLLSYLHDFSAGEACQLSGDGGAGSLLERLFRARLFITRRRGTPATYHFHALFRAFLQHEADTRLQPGDRTALLLRAGAVMEARGEIDTAARLYHAADCHAELIRLLHAQAPAMLEAGRGNAWREWAGWLPPALHDADPWLLYWHGCTLNHTAPASARTLLQRALGGFAHDAASRPARLRTLAALIDSHLYEWNGNQGLRPWCEALIAELHATDGTPLDADIALTVHSRLCMALAQNTPDHPELPGHARRALALLPQVRGHTAQLAAGTYLLEYYVSNDREIARQLYQHLHRLTDDPAVSPLYRVWWYRPASLLCLLSGDHAAAHALYQQGRHLAAEFGLPHLQCHFNARMATAALRAADVDTAAALIGEIHRFLRPGRLYDLLYVRMLEIGLYAQRGDTAAALNAAREAASLGEMVTVSVRQGWQIDAGLAFVHIQRGAAGDAASALTLIEGAIARVGGLDRTEAEDTRLLLRALIALRPAMAAEVAAEVADGPPGETAHEAAHWLPSALDACAEALAARQGRIAIMSACFPHLLRPILEYAARRGLLAAAEPQRGTSAHSPALQPPLAIRVFGPLQVLRDGTPLQARGKAQQRPLLLLKALALAAGIERPVQALAVQLWPDSEAPRTALNVTTHRLRKLLGDDEVVRVAGGYIRLDCARVSLDLIAMDEACEHADTLAAQAAPDEVRRLGAQVLDLYRGPCCEGDDLPWVLAVRAHWQRRFLAAIGRLGTWLEEHGAHADAAHLYSEALHVEPLAEALHCGLMRCAAARGHYDAVAAAYERCADLLRATLAREPSPATQQLHVTLMASVSHR